MRLFCLGCVLVVLLVPATPADAAQSSRSLSVMAYNVLFEASNLEATLTAIDRANPDVLCLTELTPKFASALERRMGERLRYRVFRPKQGTWGVGIASRFPLKQARSFQQRPHRMPAMEAQLVTPEGALQVACLHLFPPVAGQKKSDSIFDTMERNAALRKKQAAYVVRRYAREKGTVLLVGDMNESAGDAAMQTFAKAGYVRACELPTHRCGPTFPGATSVLPAVWEIDHILGKRVRFESARVIREGGSDHFPVFATFVLDAARAR